MKIEDLIGKTFCTIAQRDFRYKIEKVNEFGKVVVSLNGKPTHELSFQTPSKVVELFESGTWIFIEEEPKNPFYLDEYIYNNDAEKRVEAEYKPEEKENIDEKIEFNFTNHKSFTIGEITDAIVKSSLKKMVTKSEFLEEEKSLIVPTPKEIAFDFEVQSTIQKIQELLLVKGKEYRRNKNPYHNFEVAARKKNITPEKALDGFLLKHLVSYDDMLNDIEHRVLPKIEVVEEKFNDIICYMIIQKAQILNRINNGKNTHK